MLDANAKHSKSGNNRPTESNTESVTDYRCFQEPNNKRYV